MNTSFIPTGTSVRFYDLDRLRVLAFSILLLEHSAEIFVDWKFWIKNPETSVSLSYFTAFFLPWRMPLLFLISGAAVTLSFKRKTATAFVLERTVRLLIPLLFAVAFIIPPQIYFIKLYLGYQESFWTFYKSFLLFDWHWSPKGNIHFLHLWYLAFLFIYCILLLPVLQILRTEKVSRFLSRLCHFISQPPCLLSLGLFLTAPYYFLTGFHTNPYQSSFVYYFPFFVCGAVLWPDKHIRASLEKLTEVSLGIALSTTLSLYVLAASDGQLRMYFLNVAEVESLAIYALKSVNLWFWVLTIFGMTMRFFNYGSRSLMYATQAVYPFYILHQTVIVIIGYYIVQWNGSISTKLSAICIIAFLFMFMAYEFLLKRTPVSRLFFGIK